MLNFLNYLDNKIQKLVPIQEARRIYHGRGKEFDSNIPITIDFYPPSLLFITSYANHGPDLISEVLGHFKNQNLLKIEHILWQSRSGDRPNLEVLEGTSIESYFVYENGLKYALKIGQNQNLGFFLDMRHGREWVAAHAEGKRVLNLFSYTCSFSVQALMANAKEVINLDMSKSALELGRNNHGLNNIDKSKVKFLNHDILKSFGKITKLGPYELVILDPPFQQSSFSLVKDLGKILKRLPSFLADEALVLIAVNSPHHDWEDAKKLIIPFLTDEFVLAETLSAPSEFVEVENGLGLKIFIFEYMRRV